MPKFLDITTNPDAFLVSGDPTGVNGIVSIVKANIETISGVYGVKPALNNPSTVPVTADADSNYWIYPYASRTIVNIIMIDGRREQIELQDLALFTGGTAGWTAGTQGALNTALDDINGAL